MDALKLIAKMRRKMGIVGMTAAVGLAICVRATQPTTLALTLLSLVAFAFLMVVLQWVDRKLNPPVSRRNRLP
jgi:hypothetical protein